MAQDVNGSNVTPVKNIVKVNVLRANVKQTKVIDTDIVFVLEDGRTVFIRDGAVQSLLDNGFSVEFSDGDQATGQELLQSAGTAELSSVALTGPQASADNAAIVVQAPQATGTSGAAAPSSGGGLKTWLAVGTPLVGGVLGGVLSGGGGGSGSSAAPTTGTGTTANVKPATPVINVVADDDKVNFAEKDATAGVAVTGIAEASASVTVNWGSTSKTVTADSAGRWSASFAKAEVPADATGTTISATVKSTAGVSSDPATRTVLIDTTAPAAPVIAKVTGDDIVGPSEKAAGVDFTGTAEAGSTVTVSFAGVNKTDVADSSGNWSVNYKPAEVPNPAEYPVTATARDANGNISKVSLTSTVTVTPAIDVSGQIVAGPVQSGNGLSVDIYLANGTLLVSGVKVSADGSFTATNLPIGAGDVIFARVVDNTTAADYLDEATGVAKDLNAVLLAAKAVAGTSVTMNISPLTTIAAIKAGLAADGSGTIKDAAAATNANAATASAFGLSGIDITTTRATTTDSSSYVPSNGLDNGEKIGAILAALSGLDKANGGDVQATINALSQQVQTNGAAGTLTPEGQLKLMEGAAAAENLVPGSLQNVISDVVAASASSPKLTINAIANDNIITADETSGLTISGTVTAGASTVSVVLGSRTVDAVLSGTSWTYQASASDIAALGADGGKLLQATATFADNSSAIASRLFNLKAAPPKLPVVTLIAGETENFAVNTTEKADGFTVTGTGDLGSTILVSLGSVTKPGLVDGNGKWSVVFGTLEIPAADGSYDIIARAQDAFGNLTAPVTRKLLIDAVSPTLLTFNSVTGDNRIGPNDTSAVKFEGTAELGAVVRVLFDGKTYSGVATSTNPSALTGIWSIPLPASQIPADSVYDAVATVFDAAGNQGASVKQTITVDVVAPSKPQIDIIAGDDSVNKAERENPQGLIISGKAEAGASIEMSWGGKSYLPIKATSKGIWAFTLNADKSEIPVDGSHAISVVAVDSSGNRSEVGTRPGPVIVDTVTQPVFITSVSKQDNDIRINLADKNGSFVVEGTAEKSSFVTVKIGEMTETTTASVLDGKWLVIFTPSKYPTGFPADGQNVAVTAKSSDQAGNPSQEVTRLVQVDTVGPDKPTIDTVSGDNAINADESGASVTIRGKAEPNSKVIVNWGSRVVDQERDVDGNGDWTLIVSAGDIPSEGSVDVIVRARDAAGNVSDRSDQRLVTIDLSTGKAIVDPVGGSDNIINNAERGSGVSVTGSAEAGGKVRVTISTQTVEAPVNSVTGLWTAFFASGQLPGAGDYVVSVEAFDKFENKAATPTTKEFKVDLTSTSPEFTGTFTPAGTIRLADNIVNIAERNAGITIQGTGEAGGTAYISIGTGTPLTTSVVAAGTWEKFVAKENIPENFTGNVSVYVLDAAGNTSETINKLITIDTAAPGQPEIYVVAGDDKVNTTERDNEDGVIVSGKAEAFAKVFVTWGPGGVVKDDDADLNGNWSVTFFSNQMNAGGATNIIAYQVDLAGNIGELKEREVTVAVGTPPTPTNVTVAGDNKINLSESQATNIIITGGGGVSGATIFVTLGGVTGQTSTFGDGGTWTVTIPTSSLNFNLANLALSAYQKNSEGNDSTSVTATIPVNTAPPAILTLNAVTPDDAINATEAGGTINLSGTTDLGISSVTVAWGNGAPRTAVVQTTGNTATWSTSFGVNDRSELVDGTPLTIKVVATNGFGNINEVSRDIIVDTSPPTGLIVNLGLALDGVNISDANQGVTISGAAEVGATVVANWNGRIQTMTATNGSWSFFYSPNRTANNGIPEFDGAAVNLTVTQTDIRGNSQTKSEDIRIDTVRPIVEITGMSNDYGLPGAFNTDRNSVVLTGTSEADGKIELYIDGEFIGGSTVDSAGIWVSKEIDLAAIALGGTVTATIRAFDKLNNVNATDTTQVITKQQKIANATTIDMADVTNTSGDLNSGLGFSFAGAAAGDRINGFTTGNINGDNHKDLIFTSLFMNGGAGAPQAGGVTVVFGKANWNDYGTFDLANLGENGWVLRGTEYNTQLGQGGSGVIGDLNGDGKGELIAGAPLAANGSNTQAGAAYIVFGSTGPLGTLENSRYVLKTSDVTSDKGFVFRGLEDNDWLGNATLGISSTPGNQDFNGDGIADFFIAARNFDRPGASNVGAVVVVFGQAAGGVYGTLNNSTGQREMTIDHLTGLDKGFIIRGGAAEDNAGFSLASAGDVNGDGVTDLLIGAIGVNRGIASSAGAAYVIYGKKTQGGQETWEGLINDPQKTGRQILDLGTLKPEDGFVILGEAQNGQFGRSVEGVGDVNGDGFDDIVVGAPLLTPGTQAEAGSAYVILGSASGQGTVTAGRKILDVAEMTSAQGFIIRGVTGSVVPDVTTNETPKLGQSVGAAGDVNGDGLADIMVIAPKLDRGTAAGDLDAGRAYIIFGKKTTEIAGNVGEGWGQSVNGQSVLDLANFAAGDGFSLVGRSSISESLGFSLGEPSILSPGDLNGDGIDDLFINAAQANMFNRNESGEGVFVYGAVGFGGLTRMGTTGGNNLNGGSLNDTINGQGGSDRLLGFAGNDTLIIGDANFIRVDGGTGTDTLRLAGPGGFSLNLSTLVTGAIKDIEQIDLVVGGSLNNSLTVTQQTLLDLSTTSNRLTVLGGSGDTVNAAGFTAGSNQIVNGITYNTYTSGLAELWVQQGVTVNTAALISLNNFAPVLSWTDQADLAALVSPSESNFAPALSWAGQAVLAA